jgi:uncharacterized protein YecE (DUF72 family)
VGNVRVGTCGWADPGLIRSKRFYPPKARSAADRLAFYASKFSLVELDSSFYALPTVENTTRWAQILPAGFLMNVKAYGLLTRHAALLKTLPPDLRSEVRGGGKKSRVYLSDLSERAADQIWALHVDALRPLALADRLGVVLFQFPRWFVPSRENRDYLAQLSDRVPYPIAVEMRGGGWMADPDSERRTRELLERLGLAYVTVDEPQGFASSTPPTVMRTAEVALIRMHGRNAEAWEKKGITAAERFKYLYGEGELRPWVDTARRLASGGKVQVLFNNCYEDFATRNATEFAQMMSGDLFE